MRPERETEQQHILRILRSTINKYEMMKDKSIEQIRFMVGLRNILENNSINNLKMRLIQHKNNQETELAIVKKQIISPIEKNISEISNVLESWSDGV